MSEITQVIHIRDCQPGDVYIGRASRRNRVQGLTASIWANPFPIGYPETIERRAEVLAAYERHIRAMIKSDPATFNLEALRGKRLACFCHPKPCHGDVLVRLLAERDSDASHADPLGEVA